MDYVNYILAEPTFEDHLCFFSVYCKPSDDHDQRAVSSRYFFPIRQNHQLEAFAGRTNAGASGHRFYQVPILPKTCLIYLPDKEAISSILKVKRLLCRLLALFANIKLG
jgi:hypothetical protein